MRAVELRLESAVAGVRGHVELVAVGVTNEDVAFVTDIDPIWKARDGLVANVTQKHPILGQHGHAVALEVADVELAAGHGDVAWLGRVLRAVVVAQHLSVALTEREQVDRKGTTSTAFWVNLSAGRLP